MKIHQLFKVNKLTTKFIIILILSGLISNILVVTLFIRFNNNKRIEQQTQIALSIGKLIAAKVENKIENVYSTAKTTSILLSNRLNSPDSMNRSRKEVLELLKKIIEQNDFKAFGVYLEPNIIDGNDQKFSNKDGYDFSGNFNPYWFKNQDNTYEWIPMSGSFLKEYYINSKQNLQASLSEPHEFHILTNKLIAFSVNYPILFSNKFYGITQIDFTVDKILNSVEYDFKKMKNVSILSQNGVILENTIDKNIIGENIKDKINNSEQELESIERGQNFNFENKEEIIIYVPIHINNLNSTWQARIVIDKKELSEALSTEANWIVLISFLILLITTLIVNKYLKNLLKPLTRFAYNTKHFNFKEFDSLSSEFSSEEIIEVYDSYKTLIESINKTTEFAAHIGKGDLDIEFAPVNSKDILAKALLQMREKLKSAKEIELERKEIENKQAWITEGITKFNDILRQHSIDLKELGFRIIKNLIDYIKANQGAIFILNNEDSNNVFLELLSTVAYDERKYLTKTIALGEGLVGTCALEKITIYQKKLPKDYIQIKSGLGATNPRVLVVVPLLINEEIMGVIEITSFSELSIHEIKLLEELAESLAATLATSKINEKTSNLLIQSKEQSLKMESQKKIMEKSYMQFSNAKKDLLSIQSELDGIKKMLNISNIYIEFNELEKVIKFNDNFSLKTGITLNDISFFELRNLVSPNNINQYTLIIDTIKKGLISNEVIFLYTKTNKPLLVKAIIAPLYIKGELKKIILIGQEIQ